MAPTPIFTGRVDDEGNLVPTHAQREQRRQWLLTLKGRDVEIIVRKKRTQRSLDQSAYLHAVPFAILAEYWGEDLETTKLLVMGECFGWRDLKGGQRVPMKPSTSALTVDECSHLIEWIPPWAMLNFNVHIPLPEKVAA